jgi:hypothetical protein
MARVKDRLTKAGHTIVSKSHHVSRPQRVLVLHNRLPLDGHAHWYSACGCAGRRRKPAAGSAEIFTPSPPTYWYVPTLFDAD